ncbi:MAG: hypothetical protein J6J43_09140 [Oscillospiraceae bacterium]|nr:hypothetical protein [Oscillospiraceae bacterium]
MEYKEKLKKRLYIAIAYLVLGAAMIAGAAVTKNVGDFMSSLGLMLIVVAAVRIRNYFIITKNEQTMRKYEIAETDERNLAIISRARSAAFSAFVLLSGAAVLVLSLLEQHEAARWISYSLLLLVVLYWVAYWVIRKRL